MDRATIIRHLEQARRHVTMGERHIASQHEIVAKLEHAGHDSRVAKELLASFAELQQFHIAHRDRLEKELADSPE
jgi:hypothetical protein